MTQPDTHDPIIDAVILAEAITRLTPRSPVTADMTQRFLVYSRGRALNTWLSGELKGAAKTYSLRYMLRMEKVLCALEAEGLVEQCPSVGGSTTWRISGEED